MLSMWEMWQGGLERFLSGGQYFALFLVSFLYLYLRKTKEHKQFVVSVFVVSALMIFPLSAVLLMKYRTQFYSYESLLALLPMTLCIAYVVTQLDSSQWGWSPRKRKIWSIMIILCIVLCGDVWTAIIPSKTQNNEVINVLEIMNENEDEVLLWGPNEIVEQGRRYNSTWKVLYGRDMWQPSVRAYTYDWYSEDEVLMYEWMSLSNVPNYDKRIEKELSDEDIILLAKQKGVTTLVLKMDRGGLFSLIEDNGYTEMARTKNYVIFTESDGWYEH